MDSSVSGFSLVSGFNEHYNESSGGNFFTILATISFSRILIRGVGSF